MRKIFPTEAVHCSGSHRQWASWRRGNGILNPLPAEKFIIILDGIVYLPFPTIHLESCICNVLSCARILQSCCQNLWQSIFGRICEYSRLTFHFLPRVRTVIFPAIIPQQPSLHDMMLSRWLLHNLVEASFDLFQITIFYLDRSKLASTKIM